MSRYRILALGMVLGAAALFGTSSVACGDKLVALGGGVRFERIVVSRHPGRILVILSPGSGLAVANTRYSLTSSLMLAGHTVVEIDDPAELGSTLTTEPLDLVLIDATEFHGIALRSSSTGQAPTILPVVYQDGSSSQPATRPVPDCSADAGKAKGKNLLRTIEKTLDLRSRGLPDACGATPAGHRT
jgi:hypothetical protein